MITLVEGVIGSGKTYFVVSELMRKYFLWDDVAVCYVPNDLVVEIYTNIDGFHFGKDLNKVIENCGGIESFFTIPIQAELTNHTKHVYVVDEAQMMFPRKFYNAKVFSFFQYSRHMGIDIYLITQDIYSLVRELQTLNEYHIRVIRRSFSFLGEFRYHYMSGNEILKKKVIKPDSKIFAQYRSSLGGSDSHKTKKFAHRYVLYFVLLIGLIMGGGYGFLYMLSGGNYFKRGKQVVQIVVPKEKVVLAPVVIPVRLVGKSGRFLYFVDDQGKLARKQRVEVSND